MCKVCSHAMWLGKILPHALWLGKVRPHGLWWGNVHLHALRLGKVHPNTLWLGEVRLHALCWGKGDPALAALQVSLDDIQVELFVSKQQNMLQLYCSKNLNNEYRFLWKHMGLAYANPPFSELALTM